MQKRFSRAVVSLFAILALAVCLASGEDAPSDKSVKNPVKSKLIDYDAERSLIRITKTGGGAATLDDLPLFAAIRPKGQTEADTKPSPALAALVSLNPDDLTPKAALDALYRLKGLIGKP